MKKKDMTVAEPETVYGRGRAVQGCLMQCIVPKKDRSFFEDLAKVRSWKIIENQVEIEQPKARRSAPAKKLCGLEKAIQEVERGEVWEYASSDDMFDQILGKGTKRSKHLDESLRQIENGEYFEASSAEEMCEQIFGKGWRTK